MLPTSDGVCSAAYPEKETAESASIAQLRLARAVLPDTSLLFRAPRFSEALQWAQTCIHQVTRGLILETPSPMRLRILGWTLVS